VGCDGSSSNSKEPQTAGIPVLTAQQDNDGTSVNSSSSGDSEGGGASSSNENGRSLPPTGVRTEVPLGSFKPPLDGKLPTKVDDAISSNDKLRVVPASSWGSGGGSGVCVCVFALKLG
jgi:hypothetical protein